MSDARPLVALTLGDVAGIGPEVAALAWREPALHHLARCFVVGCPATLERACRLVDPALQVRAVGSVSELQHRQDMIECLAVGDLDVPNVEPGRIDARAGRAAFDFLIAAIDLALAGKIDAITTLPLNKVGLHAAGIQEPGHTEILAGRCGVSQHAMMLYVAPPLARAPGGLGVVHATLHVSLQNALAQLNERVVASAIALAADTMACLAGQEPRVAVAGLNPHAGEDGLFGDEEQRFIQPAIERARKAGRRVDGPIAADTLFRRAFDGEFDAVVAMYHDQGHVAVKSVAFWEAVNVTLGLPIVRTSVAHGTAYDIAWRGQARATSLIEAVRVAARLVQARRGRSIDAPRV